MSRDQRTAELCITSRDEPSTRLSCEVTFDEARRLWRACGSDSGSAFEALAGREDVAVLALFVKWLGVKDQLRAVFVRGDLSQHSARRRLPLPPAPGSPRRSRTRIANPKAATCSRSATNLSWFLREAAQRGFELVTGDRRCDSSHVRASPPRARRRSRSR
jgi:hypothetical protein